MQVPLSTVPGMDAVSITSAVGAFESLLSDPGGVLMSQCDKLVDTQLRSFAQAKVSQLLFEAYQYLYRTVMEPANQYQEPQTLFTYTPEQVKTMVDAV